MKKIQRS